jgi:hypothetical protein
MLYSFCALLYVVNIFANLIFYLQPNLRANILVYRDDSSRYKLHNMFLDEPFLLYFCQYAYYCPVQLEIDGCCSWGKKGICYQPEGTFNKNH